MFDDDYNFAIVSAHTESHDHLGNLVRHERLLAMLRFVFDQVIEVRGVYDGKPEKAVAVRIPAENLTPAWNTIEAISKYFDQECWLEGHTRHCCYLNYPDSRVVAIGYWQETAAPDGDYTEVGNKFYQCVTADLRK